MLIAAAAVAGGLWLLNRGASSSSSGTPGGPPPPPGPPPTGTACYVTIGPPPGSGAKFPTQIFGGVVVGAYCVLPTGAKYALSSANVTVKSNA